ncbi:MAG: alanyl-tRNA editing protein, partial [Candidatus Natronoplasma sp.]
MTKMLYMDDIESNYVKEFHAEVKKAGNDFVVLDRTVFYPEGGGQPSDTGRLIWDGNSSEVVKVEKKGDVIHRLKDDIPEEGTRVEGELNWEERFAHMKLHTAQHIFSAAVFERFGASTVGNQIYTEYSRVDFEPLDIGDKELKMIEEEVNRVIEEGLSVKVYEE